MTLPAAIEEVRRVGSLTVESGKLKVRFPDTDRSRLEPALAVLRANREAAIEQVSIPYPAWKAAELNRIFAEHGVLGVPGRITAATVQDGLDKAALRRRGTAAVQTGNDGERDSPTKKGSNHEAIKDRKPL
jgi:hypothetical protein